MEAKMNNVVPFANGKRESEGKKAAAEEKKKMSVDELMEKLRPAFEELEALDKKLEKLIRQEKEALEINDYLFGNETMAYLSDRETYIEWHIAANCLRRLLISCAWSPGLKAPSKKLKAPALAACSP